MNATSFPGSLSASLTREAEKRDPGNEVGVNGNHGMGSRRPGVRFIPCPMHVIC